MQFMSFQELDVEGTYIDYCLFQMTGKTYSSLTVVAFVLTDLLLSTNPAYRIRVLFWYPPIADIVPF